MKGMLCTFVVLCASSAVHPQEEKRKPLDLTFHRGNHVRAYVAPLSEQTPPGETDRMTVDPRTWKNRLLFGVQGTQGKMKFQAGVVPNSRQQLKVEIQGDLL